MRFEIVVIGVVLMVVGAVFLVIPFIAQSPLHMAAPGGRPDYQAYQVTGFSILNTLPISGTWTSNTTVIFEMLVCASNCRAPNVTIYQTLVQTGTSGSFTLSVPPGAQVGLNVSGVSGGPAQATVNVSTALTPLGSGLLLVGVVLIVLGFFLRTKKRPSTRPPARPRAAPPTITVDSTAPKK